MHCNDTHPSSEPFNYASRGNCVSIESQSGEDCQFAVQKVLLGAIPWSTLEYRKFIIGTPRRLRRNQTLKSDGQRSWRIVRRSRSSRVLFIFHNHSHIPSWLLQCRRFSHKLQRSDAERHGRHWSSTSGCPTHTTNYWGQWFDPQLYIVRELVCYMV